MRAGTIVIPENVFIVIPIIIHNTLQYETLLDIFLTDFKSVM